jgi:hypothetical protein
VLVEVASQRSTFDDLLDYRPHCLIAIQLEHRRQHVQVVSTLDASGLIQKPSIGAQRGAQLS